MSSANYIAIVHLQTFDKSVMYNKNNKANLMDLIAATGLVV